MGKGKGKGKGKGHAYESETTGSSTTGSETTGSSTTESSTTGSETTGSSTTGSETTGSSTTGSETTGTQTGGADPRRCVPEVRQAFGNTPFGTARCGSGQIFTLIDASARPMENVVAEVFNFGDCNAVFTFNRVNASPINITVQPFEDFSVRIQGQVTTITASCPTGAATGTCDAGTFVTFTQCV